MHLFEKYNNQLISLKEKPFKLEKEIQVLFESNLETILNLKLIKSEFTIRNSRIDTLVFDEESKAFVIIEYKRNQNYSVVDQGIAYLNLMLDHKADFIVEYNESQKGNLKRSDVDWSQTKIIFVSPSFTDYQKTAVNFKDLAIELCEIKRFENDVVVINPIKKSKSAPSIRQISQNEDSKIRKVIKEIKIYTEEDHTAGKSDDIIELYTTYKNAILALSPEIEVVPKKMYIAFKLKNNITDIQIQQEKLVLWLNMKKNTLDDPKKLTTDVSDRGHHGNGDYVLSVRDTSNLEYIMSLIKQVIQTI